MGTLRYTLDKYRNLASTLIVRLSDLHLQRSKCLQKMAGIFILTTDVFLYILRYLDIEDRMAFAVSCERFRRICMDERVFRKLDLSRHPLLGTQQGAINKFFRNKEIAQHITELNLSNLHVLHFQMDDHVEKFITVCSHLEALHVLNCGMSFQRLRRILKKALKLTVLSWSLWDLTSDDIEFLQKNMKSSDGICLQNIKHLHLETLELLSHIHIVKYLVLSRCKCLEELEICTWRISKEYCTGRNYPLPANPMTHGFPQPSKSVADKLQQLHSLTVESPSFSCAVNHYNTLYRVELSDFVVSVVNKKSSLTKWKKLWISPPIGLFYTPLLREDRLHELSSVEAIAAHGGESFGAVDELKTLFQRIENNNVRSLHLCNPKSLQEIFEPVLKIIGHTLKFLSFDSRHGEKIAFVHQIFSNSSNITELDLLGCCFEEYNCELLVKLKHLTKVQLTQCAISSKYSRNPVEISKTGLSTLVENCKNITHFDVRNCHNCHQQFSKDEDMLVLAKLRNLKSLTLFCLSGIREWSFLQNISEHCKFLTMLRICMKPFNKSHISISLESAKFLTHLVLNVPKVDVGSEEFWNFLRRTPNLERLCVTSDYSESINVPVAVDTLKSLRRLQVLHLHFRHGESVEPFRDQIIRMLDKEKSDRRLFFEFVMDPFGYLAPKNSIFNKALPLNIVELCDMRPILVVSRL